MNCVIDKMTSPRSLLMIQRAKELQKSDSSYISLAGGEPDFDTPAAVTEAAIASLRRGNTHYVVGPGIPELRQAIAGHLAAFRGMRVDPENILIGAGTDFLYNLLIQLLGREKVYAVEEPGYGKIRKIYVMNPIRFTNIRRNEVKSKILCSDVRSAMQGTGKELYLATPQQIVQRAAMVLQDVHYVIEAEFEMTDRAAPSDNPGKFQDIVTRRMSRGQCFHTPYFGCREFPAAFRAWPGGPIPTIEETRDLGFMLYDFNYTDPQNITPMYFHAKLEHGVLNVADCEVYR